MKTENDFDSGEQSRSVRTVTAIESNCPLELGSCFLYALVLHLMEGQ